MNTVCYRQQSNFKSEKYITNVINKYKEKGES